MKFCYLNILLILGLAACGPGYSRTDADGNPIVETRVLNQTKMIRADSDEGQDDGDFQQATYRISSNSRLLTKYLGFQKHQEEILQNGKKLFLEVTVLNKDDLDKAEKSLRLCPLTRSWSLLATWFRASPLTKKGEWPAGGAIDNTACVAASREYPIVKPTPGPTPANRRWMEETASGVKKTDTVLLSDKALYFNLGAWFEDYPLGRNVNFGFALISSEEVEIFGDASSSYSPRLLWPR